MPLRVVIEAKDKKRGRGITIVGMIVVMIGLIAVLLFLGSGEVTRALRDDIIHVSASFMSVEIPYQDLT